MRDFARARYFETFFGTGVCLNLWHCKMRFCCTLEAYRTGGNLGSLFRQCPAFKTRGAKIGFPFKFRTAKIPFLLRPAKRNEPDSRIVETRKVIENKPCSIENITGFLILLSALSTGLAFPRPHFVRHYCFINVFPVPRPSSRNKDFEVGERVLCVGGFCGLQLHQYKYRPVQGKQRYFQ